MNEISIRSSIFSVVRLSEYRLKVHIFFIKSDNHDASLT